jgi:hypothetical protein
MLAELLGIFIGFGLMFLAPSGYINIAGVLVVVSVVLISLTL